MAAVTGSLSYTFTHQEFGIHVLLEVQLTLVYGRASRH